MNFKDINMDDIYTGDINEMITDSIMLLDYLFTDFGMALGAGDVLEPEVKLYKKDATLIKVADCGYVDIDDIKNTLSCIKINRKLSKNGHEFTLGGIVMQDDPMFLRAGNRYVVHDTLKPYIADTESKGQRVSYKQLKRK